MPHSNPPGWVDDLAWAFIALASVCAGVVSYDIAVRGHRQRMAVMNLVYPLTALYFGPVALYVYFAYGRAGSRSKPRWWPVTESTSHCGAGCALGDLLGEWIVFAAALTLAGISLPDEYLLDFAFAWLFGIAFQYFAIVPMLGATGLKGIWLAIRADTLSIVAFEVGLFAGMAIYSLVIWSPSLATDSATYWLMMQVSMIVGSFTSMPVNALLLKWGWKEAM